MSLPPPYLSVVVTTRNDDHGGSLLQRMQAFVNGLTGQAMRHGVPIELVVVEWNPPPERPRLREALRWPAGRDGCQVRFIEVPGPVHARYKNAQALPLYQMIGKNVGIRRAAGEFVLATNIDILFRPADELPGGAAVGSGAHVSHRPARCDGGDSGGCAGGRPIGLL